MINTLEIKFSAKRFSSMEFSVQVIRFVFFMRDRKNKEDQNKSLKIAQLVLAYAFINGH